MKNLYLLVVLLFSINYFSQNKSIEYHFSKSQESFQEVVYAHLNKSKYVTGEMLGFTAYVFDKKNKKLSKETTNLYCTLSDKNDNVVLGKLFKVENGIVDGYFMINDSIKSGNYTFKSFTNWMRNFSQNNYHSEQIQIIDAEAAYNSKKKEKSFIIDAQFLPESGHLLDGVINTVGVIIKDELGLGIPNISGKVFDNEDNYITSFKLNKNGIGRFSFTPNFIKTYKVEVDNRNKKITIPIKESIKRSGLLLQVSRNTESALVSITSNKTTKLDDFYELSFHNGKSIQIMEIDFNGKKTITKKIPLEKLPPGITVFTLFNEKNIPIAERLFFNYKNITVLKSKNEISKKDGDSRNIFLGFQKDLGKNNVSISILPSTTTSYEKNTNIVSKVYLEPYIKGTIENADYYFNQINKETIQDLDNLLITQGWSSYDWNNIFSENRNNLYSFEKGIDIKVNLVKLEKNGGYLIHRLSNTDAKMIELSEEIKSFSSSEHFPLDDEKLNISRVDKKGKLEQNPLYVQFSINGVPKFETETKFIPFKPNYFAAENFVDFQKFQKLNNREELKEVVIKVDLKQKRRDSIKKRSWGDVYFPEKKDEGMLLSYFLDSKPSLLAYDNHPSSSLYVLNTIADAIPAIFVDDLQLIDNKELFLYPMIDIDFIEINLNSLEGGSRYRGGVIKIKTNRLTKKNNKKTINEIEFPITFTKPKKFYIPKYENYNDPFFKNYGVIDWLPTKSIDENGMLHLKIDAKKQKEVTLFLQGVSENGFFILDEKKIVIN